MKYNVLQAIGMTFLVIGGVFALFCLFSGKSINNGELLTEAQKMELSGKIEVSHGTETVNGDLDEPASVQSTEEQTEDDRMKLLEAYKQYNSDVYGLIRIKDTVLDHPVMRSEYEEGYYLNRDLDKKSNSHGVPFISLDSNLLRGEGNSIIYGHNIRIHEKDVFSELRYYEDVDYYKEHPVIEIVTDEGISEWLIFAYYLIDTSDADTFAYYETTDFLSMQKYEDYMAEVEKRNFLSVPIEHDYHAAYLTLSSCSVELSGSGTNRMVVMAKLLDKDEAYMDVVNSATKTSNPLLPAKLR